MVTDKWCNTSTFDFISGMVTNGKLSSCDIIDNEVVGITMK